MACRLKATNKKRTVLRRTQPIDLYAAGQSAKSNYCYYPTALITKTAALERLSGVKSSGKTHYSALKKSIAEMQKCNLYLTKSQREVANLYELLKKKADQTLAILEVTRAVSNILPFEQILQETNRLVSKLMGSVKCYLLELKKDSKISFQPYVAGDLGDECLSKLSNESAARWSELIKNKKPVQFKIDSGNFLIVPLVSRGNIIGVLAINRRTGSNFTPEEIELCVGIANPVAVAIENRTLVEKLKQESFRLKTALFSLKITSDNLAMLNKGVEPILQASGEALLKITDADYGIILAGVKPTVSLHVPDEIPEKEWLDNYFFTRLHEITSEKNFCPYGAREINLKKVSELSFLTERYSFKQMVIFPMITREKVLGLFVLFFKDYCAGSFCQYNLQVLANQTAIVLENAKLFQETIQLKEQAEAHYQLACAQKEQLEKKNLELKNMYNILFSTREKQIITQERNRIASDLHDNVLQILFAIGLHLEWCFEKLPVDSPVYEKLKDLNQLVSKAVKEIRKVVTEFSSTETSVSLYDSIKSLVDDLNQAGSVRINVQAVGTIPTLPVVTRNIAYRIVQEGLVNALRHASATVIDIVLSYEEEILKIAIRDNGVGISESVMDSLNQDKNKFGLKSMMQRAQYVNGKLEINGLDTGGTEVLAEIPIGG